MSKTLLLVIKNVDLLGAENADGYDHTAAFRGLIAWECCFVRLVSNYSGADPIFSHKGRLKAGRLTCALAAGVLRAALAMDIPSRMPTVHVSQLHRARRVPKGQDQDYS